MGQAWCQTVYPTKVRCGLWFDETSVLSLQCSGRSQLSAARLKKTRLEHSGTEKEQIVPEPQSPSSCAVRHYHASHDFLSVEPSRKPVEADSAASAAVFVRPKSHAFFGSRLD
jgi:hypothetical protein